MEWLCIRLDLLSSITFATSLMFLISIPVGLIDPGILASFSCYLKTPIITNLTRDPDI